MTLEVLACPTRNRGRKPRPGPKPPYLAEDPLLNVDEASAEVNVAKSTFWREVKAGRMPAPIHVTPKCPRWKRSELRAAIEAKRILIGERANA